MTRFSDTGQLSRVVGDATARPRSATGAPYSAPNARAAKPPPDGFRAFSNRQIAPERRSGRGGQPAAPELDGGGQLVRCNSLQKAYFVECERPGFQGWPGVTAMPAEPPEGRKVKSGPVGRFEGLWRR